MCDPATIAIAAAAASAIGTGFSAIQQANMHRYQARVADRNAQLAAEAGRQEQDATRQTALDHYRRVAQLKGAQRAQMAANGIDINFGSAADVQGDTEMLAREDTSRIYEQGSRNVRARDFEGANYGGEASAQRTAATGSLISGAFDVAATALGASQQFGKVRGRLPASGRAG